MRREELYVGKRVCVGGSEGSWSDKSGTRFAGQQGMVVEIDRYAGYAWVSLNFRPEMDPTPFAFRELELPGEVVNEQHLEAGQEEELKAS